MSLTDTIFITGGHGFIGANLAAELTVQGYTNVIQGSREIDGDLLHHYAMFTILARFDPAKTIVIHLAANVGGIGYNRDFPATLFEDNMRMGQNVISACAQSKIKKLVIIGTVCSYPRIPVTIPFVETELWDGFPEETNAAYGIAKRALWSLAEANYRQNGLNFNFLLPANIYGPYDDFSSQGAHVIPDLIRKYNEVIVTGKTSVKLWGTGTPTRDFFYVEDCVKAIIQVMESYNSNEPTNIASGVETSIADVANQIAAIIGFTGETIWDETQPDGQPRRVLNITKAQAGFDFNPTTNLTTGLQATINWFNANV